MPYDVYGDKMIGFYHMKDFMDQYLVGDMDKECSDFLSKFDIFSEIWASIKDDAYSFFKELVEDSLKYDLEDIPDLVLSATYQNGVIVNNNLDTQQAGGSFNASV